MPTSLLDFFANTTNLLLSIGVVIVLALIIANELHSKVLGPKRFSALQLVQFINRDTGLVLDIRGQNDYRKGHIAHSKNIPLSDLEKRASELEKHKSSPIVLVCALGNTASTAAAKLKKLGFEPHILVGGLNAWQGASLPVVKA